MKNKKKLSQSIELHVNIKKDLINRLACMLQTIG